jgi:hypothetical protein
LSEKLTAVNLYNEPKAQLLIKIFPYWKWILHLVVLNLTLLSLPYNYFYNEEDLRILGIINWPTVTRNWKEWRIVLEARVHSRL